MTGEWRASTWGEEISLEYGKALRDYDKVSGKYRVFGSNGPIGWTDKPLASGPGVILGRKGAYRGIEFSRESFFVIDTAYYVVPKSELDMRWLYYAIKHHKLGEIDDGSPIPSTTRSAVYVRDFDIPPLSTQKRIAHILGTLDDKIELNRRMNATLEGMARALFQSWFIDFDPGRRNMDRAQSRFSPGLRPPSPNGRGVGGEGAVSGLAELDALFPDSFQESEMGHIPKAWTAQRLPDAIEVNPRRTLKGGTIAPYLDMKNLPTQGHSAEEVIDREFTSGTKFQNGDTLLARSDALRTHAIQNMTGTSGRQRVPSECFNTFWLAVPPPQIARRFDEITAPPMAKVKVNSAESRTLATLRDTLLPKLLSGELSVAEVNKEYLA